MSFDPLGRSYSNNISDFYYPLQSSMSRVSTTYEDPSRLMALFDCIEQGASSQAKNQIQEENLNSHLLRHLVGTLLPIPFKVIRNALDISDQMIQEDKTTTEKCSDISNTFLTSKRRNVNDQRKKEITPEDQSQRLLERKRRNRESAARYRQKKRAHLKNLENEVAQLRVQVNLS